MTDRERLICLLSEYDFDSTFCNICERSFDDCAVCGSERLADYLLANGVIVPPCKLGDTVWFIRNNEIIETCVEKIILKHGGLYIKLCCNSMYETTCNSIGKTVFLTREEAEKALKERESNA